MHAARRSLLLLALAALPGTVFADDEAAPEAPSAVDPEVEHQILSALSHRPARAAGALPAIGTEVELLLADGQRLRGRFAGSGANALMLEVAGGRIAIPSQAVRSIGAPTRLALHVRDANRTRYLYSPSGFMLKQGEGYLSQTELLLSSVAYGVTDWLTVQAGTVLPIAVYQPRYTPGIVAVKAGGSLSERWHVAGGFQSFALPGDTDWIAFGFLFGTVTWGTENLHFGLSAGPPFALSGEGRSEMGDVLFSVSANWRAFEHGALVSENWIIAGGGAGTHVVGSAAYRFIAERIAVDVGLLFSDVTGGIPIPWLDFTWHWGT